MRVVLFLKKVRIRVLGAIRLLVLRLTNPKLRVGSEFFCASGCRVSSGREIVIGDNFYMGYNCHLGANMIIGDSVIFASEVAVVGGDHKIDNISVPIRFSGRDVFKMTVFEDGCWIGHRAIVLHGVRIGEGAVVGAGSVVTKDVEAFSIVCGNPAKFVRYRDKITD